LQHGSFTAFPATDFRWTVDLSVMPAQRAAFCTDCVTGEAVAHRRATDVDTIFADDGQPFELDTLLYDPFVDEGLA
jgi:hypothetical protein